MISLEGCLKPKNNETYFHRGAPMCAVLFFDQGCRVSTQCNLLVGCCERILMQPWAQVMDYSLPGFTSQLDWGLVSPVYPFL